MKKLLLSSLEPFILDVQTPLLAETLIELCGAVVRGGVCVHLPYFNADLELRLHTSFGRSCRVDEFRRDNPTLRGVASVFLDPGRDYIEHMQHRKSERRLLALFLEGLVALMPLALTALIIYWIASAIIHLVGFVPEQVLALIFRDRAIPEFLVPVLWIALYAVIGVAFFLVTALLGAVIRRSIGRRLFDLWERLLSKIPIIRNLYEPLKQVLSSLLGGKKDRFKRVVLVEYPRRGLYSLAFVTSEIVGSDIADSDEASPGADPTRLLTLFIPSSPNPTTGWMLVVPDTEVTDVNLSVEEGVKLIFSGGLVTGSRNRFESLLARISADRRRKESPASGS